MKIVLGCLMVVSLSGCFWKPTKLVAFPDSPALITEQRRGYVRLALWSRERGKMVDYGWMKVKDYKGWTLHKYDWETHQERLDARNRQPDN